MNKELSERIENLESSLKILISKFEDLQKKNSDLTEKLAISNDNLKDIKQQNAELKEKYQRMKIASALGGNGDGVKETKLRINRLVREIDSCISIMQG